MAEQSPWSTHIEVFVDASRSKSEQASSIVAITSLVKNDQLTIETLVIEMETYLTATDHVIRARGILLLAELLGKLATKNLDDAAVHSLMDFFSSRLADWHALHGALIGCLVLLRRKKDVGMVSSTDAKTVAQSYFGFVQVQSLAFEDRKLSFELLECLLVHYPESVASLDEDLIYGVCTAIDEEKDPRCLILTFNIVAILVSLFPDLSSPIASSAEDLFDILSSYFPIYFTHQSADIDIKRDELSMALMHTFSSTPYFEPFVIPLLLDKLSSTLPLAKIDSLKYLSHCSLKYGSDRMAKHAKSIWSSLKATILKGLEEDKETQRSNILREALTCLERMLQLDKTDDNLFLTLILEDEDLYTLFKSVTSVGNTGQKETKQELYVLGSILSTSAMVSYSCCTKVVEHYFPSLMHMLGVSQSNFPFDFSHEHKEFKNISSGALYLCVCLLGSCRDFATKYENTYPQDKQDTRFDLIQTSLPHLIEVFETVLLKDNEYLTQEDLSAGGKGLQILATLPEHFVLLSNELYTKILMILMSILSNRWKAIFLWKEALGALSQIGASVKKYDGSIKSIIYMNLVVEELISQLSSDVSTMPQLKLEALVEIGRTDSEFMLRVEDKLKRTILSIITTDMIQGSSPSSTVLSQMLDCYSAKIIPWFQQAKHSKPVTLNFALSLWKQIEICRSENVNTLGQVHLNALIAAMKSAVGDCSEKDQNLIVQTTYDIISLKVSISFKQEVAFTNFDIKELLIFRDDWTGSSIDEFFVSLFASVIISLRPQTQIPNPRILLKLFLAYTLNGNIPSAHALGSIINKWPVKGTMIEANACTLEEMMSVTCEKGFYSILEYGLLRRCYSTSPTRPCDSIILTHAIIGLAWIGKGLAMRKHDKSKEIFMFLLKCLSLGKSMENNGEFDLFFSSTRAAADSFRIIMSDSEYCLNRRLHAIMNPLFKQYFFSILSPILLSSIKESNSSFDRFALYQALGHVISHSPLVAVVAEVKKIITPLLDALSMLSSDMHLKDLTYSLLLVLAGILMDETGKETVIENAHIIISQLISLITYPHMMVVRETAIQCLVAMSELPYTRIYPMRVQVLLGISKALDDPKRQVRQEAIKCRQTWASMASRSLQF